MKKDWPSKKLGEVCEIMNGGTPKTAVPEYWDGGHLGSHLLKWAIV